MNPRRPNRRTSPHFFMRDPDGGVRLRIRFMGEEASLIEEAAGSTPLMTWIHNAINRQARADIEAARAKRPKVAPPEGE